MKFANVRTLKNQTSEMLRHAAGGNDVIITSHGKPVAVLRKMTEEDMEDYVLSRHPAIRASIEASHREVLAKGGIPLGDVIRTLEAKAKKGKRRGRLRG
jgi:antitoxin (DNA-binding transcriptional repressor) of toxin-antitoxin stability system